MSISVLECTISSIVVLTYKEVTILEDVDVMASSITTIFILPNAYVSIISVYHDAPAIEFVVCIQLSKHYISTTFLSHSNSHIRLSRFTDELHQILSEEMWLLGKANLQISSLVDAPLTWLVNAVLHAGF